jgi:hypothetical protein
MSSPSGLPKPYHAAWPLAIGVVGLDYMSTLGYVPSIAFDAAGRLAPLVCLAVVAVTLLGALPVYCYLAGRSPSGQGGIALIEKLIPGWFGKTLLLFVLGFAAADLIFTRTFSTADAAEHLIHGPHPQLQDTLNRLGQHWDANKGDAPDAVKKFSAKYTSRQFVVTVGLLIAGTVIGLIFIRGFQRSFIRLAIVTTGLYMLLTGLIVGAGLYKLAENPDRFEAWWSAVEAGDWQAKHATHTGDAPASHREIAAASARLFPHAALGLSGFEMAMLLMPLILGRPDDGQDRPRGRIRNTRKLLFVSAILMGISLVGSSLVTTIFIPPEAFRIDGQAQNRALAYLAHGGRLEGFAEGETLAPILGLSFGTVYDLTTVWILCLAGVGVGITLAKLVPPYLQKLGMEFEWSKKIGAMTMIFVVIKLVVTVFYSAGVDEQRSAYTMSVLVVFTAASFSSVLDAWKSRSWMTILFLPALLVFGTSTVRTVIDRPSGLWITLAFIGIVLVISIATRAYRSTELRFRGFEFDTDESRIEFEKLKTADFPILVPHRPGQHTLAQKEVEIRSSHRIPAEMPVVFVVADLGDPSDFFQLPLIRVCREEGRVVIQVSRCVSIAHTIAAIAIEMSRVGVAPEIHFGWSDENPITANLHFVMFGHGNVPWIVYRIVRAAPLPDNQRPRVMIG